MRTDFDRRCESRQEKTLNQATFHLKHRNKGQLMKYEETHSGSSLQRIDHHGELSRYRARLSLMFVACFFLGATTGCDSGQVADSRRSEKKTYRVQDVGPKWYEGGTLHRGNALDWQEASEEDKLATCADFISTMWMQKRLKPIYLRKITSVNDMKPFAQELVVALDEAFKKEPNSLKNKQLYVNQKISDSVVLLATMMGWLK
jgi:hypothetical protein